MILLKKIVWDVDEKVATTLRFVKWNKSAASDTDSVLRLYLLLLSSSCDGKLWAPEVERGFFCPHIPARLLYVVVPSSDSLSELSCFRAAIRLSFIFLCQKRRKPEQREDLKEAQWRQTWRTLEILSLLHWLTPLLTLTMHSTARLRACCTSSSGGTMEMFGIERVTLALKMACWLLLLPRLGTSPSAEWSLQFNAFTQGKHGRHTHPIQLMAAKNKKS